MECVTDMVQENTLLQSEINGLRQRIKALQETVETLTLRNIQLLAERDAMTIAAVGSQYLCIVVLCIVPIFSFYSFITDIYIAPLEVHYYSEAFPTTALILCQS